jgi:hypothetical protein
LGFSLFFVYSNDKWSIETVDDVAGKYLMIPMSHNPSRDKPCEQELIELKKNTKLSTGDHSIFKKFMVSMTMALTDHQDDRLLLYASHVFQLSCNWLSRLVEPTSWIHESVIDCYGQILYGYAMANKSKTLVLPSTVLQSTENFAQKDVQKLIASARNIFRHFPGNFFWVDYDKILLPLNVANSHWVLVHIICPKFKSDWTLLQRGEICVYDSYHRSNTISADQANIILTTLSLMVPKDHPASKQKTEDTFNLVEAVLPQNSIQSDVSSCGIYVLTLMEYFVDNIDIVMNFPSTKDMQSRMRRTKTAATIFLKRILYS